MFSKEALAEAIFGYNFTVRHRIQFQSFKSEFSESVIFYFQTALNTTIKFQ